MIQLLDKICYIETEYSFKIYIMILLLNLIKQKGLKIRYYVSYWLYLRYYNDLFDFFYLVIRAFLHIYWNL